MCDDAAGPMTNPRTLPGSVVWMNKTYTSVLSDPARLRAIAEAVRPRAYPAPPYTHITRVVCETLTVPIALVSLVDDRRQFFPGSTGLPADVEQCGQTPLSHSFCQHVVAGGCTLRVTDSRVNAQVRDNLAVRDLGVIGYLGVPLKTSTGHILGSLCAITHEPREWTDRDEEILENLAVAVVSDLELRGELAYREAQSRLKDPSIAAEGLPARSFDILDSINDGVIAIDRAWRITFLNRRAVRLLHTPRRRAIGAPLWELFPAIAGGEIESALRDAAASGRPTRTEALVPELSRWFELRTVPMRHGMSVYFDDVTERRNARAALELREEQLRQSQKMEAIGALAGGIAHDFNNMLTVVRANCEVLVDRLEPHSDGRLELLEIKSAAVRATALTQQLLAFSRKQVVQPRVLDVNATLQALAPMLRRLIPANVRVDALCAPRALHVLADPTQLEQVMMNLVLNARDAMPNGGTIAVECSAVTLKATMQTPLGELAKGRWVRIAVSDSGTGIQSEVMPHIFEPFFTTKPLGAGTGLGLATVFGIVQQLGGGVTVESAPGRGTAFHVYLPASEVTTVVDEAEPTMVESRGAECILIAEDEPAVRHVVERVLTAHGYRLLVARDGREALDLMQEHGASVDLVLSDVMMPGVGGVILAERLRDEHPDVPVMLMSGYGETDSVQNQLGQHGVAFLQKPFNAALLTAAVRAVLDARPVALTD